MLVHVQDVHHCRHQHDASADAEQSDQNAGKYSQRKYQKYGHVSRPAVIPAFLHASFILSALSMPRNFAHLKQRVTYTSSLAPAVCSNLLY